MPLVSIIIPTYNSSKFLSRTIESVLGQTHQNFELIIVDDASIDGTVDIIKKFSERDRRIRYVVMDINSGGPVKPTNKGLSMVQGEYIAFLDHDDEWLPTKLEEQIAVLQASSSDVGAVICDVELRTEKKETTSFYRFPEYPDQESILNAMLCANFFFNFSILCMRRTTADRIGSLDERFVLGADHDYYIRIAEACSITVIHKPLLRYIEHPHNLSRSERSIHNAIADLDRLLDKQNDLFAQHPECRRHRMIQLASALISIGKGGDARAIMQKVVAARPWAPDALFYYALTFTGKRTHRALKWIKHRLR